MFQFIRDPKIDFMGKARIWVTISAAAIVLSLAVLAVRGLNLGIEFTGGAELQLKYATEPDPGAVRAALEAAGLRNFIVTTISDAERSGERDVYIRVGIQQEGGQEEDLAQRVVHALRAAAGTIPADRIDLNSANEDSLRASLASASGVSADQAAAISKAMVEKRKEAAIVRSVDDLSALPGMTPEALDFLRARTVVGPFAVRSQSYVGPAIGRELVQKALWAIVGSLAAMMIYIWFRFQLQSGLAAVLALIHDTIVTLGLFAAFGLEMSLAVVAAFLTLIGYSVNDTVVIFDRIRENLKNRGGGDLSALINQSINQTLSRTVITSGLTWLVCAALLIFGGDTLRPFSFVLVVGIIVGSYSTIFVAGPVLLAWHNYIERRKHTKRGSAPASPVPAAAHPSAKKAKKVRTTSASS